MSTRGEPTGAGRWLRHQRERRGVRTQAELARRLGWDKTAVNNYETRGVTVPDERAEQLAEFFGLDVITVRRNLGLWVPGEEPEGAPSTDDPFANLPEDPEGRRRRLIEILEARARETAQIAAELDRLERETG